MIEAAGRSMGRRSLACTGLLLSSGRPSGSMTRPSNESPTATSTTRPVRRTSSPACRRQDSPSRTTPISFSSTLKAIPDWPPRNSSNSSKPTPGRPATLATPVETLTIVPTSCNASPGLKASRAFANAAIVRSKPFSKLPEEAFIDGSLPGETRPALRALPRPWARARASA